MIELLRLLNEARIDACARTLVGACDVVGWLADTTGRRAERYAASARWIAAAMRAVP